RSVCPTGWRAVRSAQDSPATPWHWRGRSAPSGRAKGERAAFVAARACPDTFSTNVRPRRPGIFPVEKSRTAAARSKCEIRKKDFTADYADERRWGKMIRRLGFLFLS